MQLTKKEVVELKFAHKKAVAMVLAKQYYRKNKKDISVVRIVNRPKNEQEYAEDAYDFFISQATEIIKAIKNIPAYHCKQETQGAE